MNIEHLQKIQLLMILAHFSLKHYVQ